MELPRFSRTEPDPAEVAALGTAGVRRRGPSPGRLRVDRPAAEAADGLQHSQRSVAVPRSYAHAQREAGTCRNLRLAVDLVVAVPAGVERDPTHAPALGAGLGLLLLEWQLVDRVAVEAADERALRE